MVFIMAKRYAKVLIQRKDGRLQRYKILRKNLKKYKKRSITKIQRRKQPRITFRKRIYRFFVEYRLLTVFAHLIYKPLEKVRFPVHGRMIWDVEQEAQDKMNHPVAVEAVYQKTITARMSKEARFLHMRNKLMNAIGDFFSNSGILDYFETGEEESVSDVEKDSAKLYYSYSGHDFKTVDLIKEGYLKPKIRKDKKKGRQSKLV